MPRKFKIGDEVTVGNISTWRLWLKGKVGKVIGLQGRGYIVDLNTVGTLYFRGRELYKKGQRCPHCDKLF